MFDSQKPHPFLAQVPLTVSPFLSIPTAVTLPYSFRSVPATLPPSVLIDTQNGENAKIVKSVSGHVASPEDIIASCQSLQQHLSNTSIHAKQLIKSWEDEIKQRDLAEKRKIAPGWLDRDEKLLEPTKASQNQAKDDLLSEQPSSMNAPVMSPNREGEDLDKVFGRVSIK